MEEPRPITFSSNPVVTTPYSSVDTSLPFEKTSCSWVNEKGSQAGKKCDKPTFNNSVLCAAHITVDLRRKRNSIPSREKPEDKQNVSFNDEEPEDYPMDDDEDEEDIPELSNYVTVHNNDKIDDNRIVSILEKIVTILTTIRLK